MGRDVKVEFPKNPDIVIKNDGSKTVSECVDRILEYKIDARDTYSRDRDYWNNYYSGKNQCAEPSPFALYISTYLKSGERIMDLGCGNGRDSLFFMEKGLYVIGVDAADRAIARLREENRDKRCEFICDDFASSKILYQREVEHCYSRFTLHAINERQEDLLLENVYAALKENGRFYIEARSVNDDLYGLGKRVAEHTWVYNEHFRRFIDINRIREKLENVGFKIEYAAESRGFAPMGDDDPVLVRIICRK